jgi:elongation factor Ts
MDCKQALQACQGDMARAVNWLRERGIALAARRADRPTGEGRIGCYIHAGSRIGAMVEVTCETDFVARTEEFAEFTHHIAMQVAAQQPAYLSPQDIPKDVLEKELEIYRAAAAREGKPPGVQERIAQGRLEKLCQDVCLLEQPFIRDPDRTVGQYVQEVAGKLGENIRIRRFARFQVGQDLDEPSGSPGGEQHK